MEKTVPDGVGAGWQMIYFKVEIWLDAINTLALREADTWWHIACQTERFTILESLFQRL